MFFVEQYLDHKQKDNKPKIAIVLHRPSGGMGYLGSFLQQSGFALDIYCPILGQKLPDTLEHHAGVVILGGPMSVNDRDAYISEEIDWISLSLKENKPFLGICLGAQMLARNLGGCVEARRDGYVEVGWYPLQVMPQGETMMDWPKVVYHFHNEGIYDLPKDVILLATGQTYPVQAFCYGDKAWGLQFHPELTRMMIRNLVMHLAKNLTQKGVQPAFMHFEGYSMYGQTLHKWFKNALQRIFGASSAFYTEVESHN
ncbi:glutamine amidotransferase [Bartonella bacilliformis]|uniref:Glutamine amidotransferase domain-containing protein n=1 Tax=Bartonella bacilliformis Ver097 TaxID=1293911 RepID=A0A072R7Y7_BARBA|nr:glutamine amidotransferase [Bartonella bacilliformis]KEG21327.1 hypothetical protein H710_00276 [Bartonella bacilliformis Ver097]